MVEKDDKGKEKILEKMCIRDSPGIRPGAPTADYIRKILSRITLIGAMFLAVIAMIPLIYGAAAGMGQMSIGGTSIIIVVGVALETVKQLESQMMMRHYKGFLD